MAYPLIAGQVYKVLMADYMTVWEPSQIENNIETSLANGYASLALVLAHFLITISPKN